MRTLSSQGLSCAKVPGHSSCTEGGGSWLARKPVWDEAGPWAGPRGPGQGGTTRQELPGDRGFMERRKAIQEERKPGGRKAAVFQLPRQPEPCRSSSAFFLFPSLFFPFLYFPFFLSFLLLSKTISYYLHLILFCNNVRCTA